VGFLAQAHVLASGAASSVTARLVFNNRLDAAVTAMLVVMVTLILIESARHWIGILTGRKQAVVKEAPFTMTRLAGERA
jgi:carbon starvation protein